MKKTAVVFLADGFEEIEATCAIDILRRVGVEVTVAGLKSQPVKGSRGLAVVPDVSVDELTASHDAYVLPGGGAGANHLSQSVKVSQLIMDAFEAGKIIAAICAAPAVVLSPLGVLEGKKATCYPDMQSAFPSTTTYQEKPVVVDGNIITSRGPGTAIAFALTIAEKLVGDDIRRKVAQATLVD